jgi:hypothetical protein
LTLCFAAFIFIGSRDGALWLFVLFIFRRFSKSFIFSSFYFISLSRTGIRSHSFSRLAIRFSNRESIDDMDDLFSMILSLIQLNIILDWLFKYTTIS